MVIGVQTCALPICLYVADASVLPEGLGVPPVLSILALGGRLVRHLLTEGGHT